MAFGRGRLGVYFGCWMKFVRRSNGFFVDGGLVCRRRIMGRSFPIVVRRAFGRACHLFLDPSRQSAHRRRGKLGAGVRSGGRRVFEFPLVVFECALNRTNRGSASDAKADQHRPGSPMRIFTLDPASDERTHRNRHRDFNADAGCRGCTIPTRIASIFGGLRLDGRLGRWVRHNDNLRQRRW